MNLYIPDPPPPWPPRRERPTITTTLQVALDSYRTATLALITTSSAWSTVKAWWRQWRAERAAYATLRADHAALRYVFMTAFDRGMWIRESASRGEILEYAVKLFDIGKGDR